MVFFNPIASLDFSFISSICLLIIIHKSKRLFFLFFIVPKFSRQVVASFKEHLFSFLSSFFSSWFNYFDFGINVLFESFLSHKLGVFILFYKKCCCNELTLSDVNWVTVPILITFSFNPISSFDDSFNRSIFLCFIIHKSENFTGFIILEISLRVLAHSQKFCVLTWQIFFVKIWL